MYALSRSYLWGIVWGIVTGSEVTGNDIPGTGTGNEREIMFRAFFLSPGFAAFFPELL